MAHVLCKELKTVSEMSYIYFNEPGPRSCLMWHAFMKIAYSLCIPVQPCLRPLPSVRRGYSFHV